MAWTRLCPGLLLWATVAALLGSPAPLLTSSHTIIPGATLAPAATGVPGAPSAAATAPVVSDSVGNWSPISGRSSHGLPDYRLTTLSRSTASCRLTFGSGWLAYDAATTSFWVAAPPDCVDVIPANPFLSVTSLPVGTDPFGVAVDNATGDVFVTNLGSDNVTVISDQTNRSVANVSVGIQPSGIAYDWRSGDIYVADSGSDNVSVVSATTLTVVATVAVGTGPVGIAADPASGQVFVANNGSDNVSVISDTTRSVVATVQAGSTPWGVAVDNASDRVFVTNSGTSNVTVISAATDLPVRTIPVIAPDITLQGLAYDPRTSTVWIGAGNWYLVVLNATTLNVSGFQTVDPAGVAYDADNGDICVTEVANFSFACLSQPRFGAVPLIFQETGLPTGSPWTVDLENGSQLSTSVNASFGIIPYIYISTSTYTISFSIPPVGGVPASPSSGNVTVGFTTVVVSVTFSVTAQLYPVWFNETGLPNGAAWEIDLNGTAGRSDSSSNLVFVTNGTYGFQVPSVGGYRAVPRSGTVTVNGSAVGWSISFILTLYSVTFTENGLPLGTSWNLSLNGNPAIGTGPAISWSEPNGSYAYTISRVGDYEANPNSGTFEVVGGPVSVGLGFVRIPAPTYGVSFTETGLASGTTWGVTLNGTTENGSGSGLAFTEPNGSYAFTIASPTGFAASPASGSVPVEGSAASVSIVFVQSPPPIVVNFSYPELVSCGGPVNATFTSEVRGGTPPYSYLWSFGDGSGPSTLADPTHEFSADALGSIVSLNVTDSVGATGNHSAKLVVLFPPCPPPFHSENPGPVSSSTIPWTLYGVIAGGAVVAIVIAAILIGRSRRPR